MLLALRHHAVVGGDGEQHEVDTVRARQHVADEALMPRDIDDARARSVGQREIREAEIDRDPALLLFLQAVGVVAGQRLDERGLAMIDVTGSADDRVSDLRHGLRRQWGTVRLRNLLRIGRQIEVVAPQGDLPAAYFEHPCDRDLDALLADVEHVDPLIEHDAAVRCRVKNLELDPVRARQERIDGRANRVPTFGRLHRHVVVYRVFGEVGHDLVDVLALEGFAKVRDDFFRFVGHETYSCARTVTLPMKGRVRGRRPPSLGHLLGEHLHVEVVAPLRDLAAADFEYACDRQLDVFAALIEYIDALVEYDISSRTGVQNLESDLVAGILRHERFDGRANRGLAAHRLHRNVVIDGVVGEVAHDRFEVLALERFAKVVDDFFSFACHVCLLYFPSTPLRSASGRLRRGASRPLRASLEGLLLLKLTTIRGRDRNGPRPCYSRKALRSDPNSLLC